MVIVVIRMVALITDDATMKYREEIAKVIGRLLCTIGLLLVSGSSFLLCFRCV